MPADLDAARDVLAAADRVTVLTGAGISTDSGIPDFRGPNGVWTRNPAAERTSTLRDYLGDPDVRRQAWRNRLASPAWTAAPNAGHLALVELERQGRLQALLTQNIDGLHQRAGSSPERVVELHGSIHGCVCWTCGDRRPMLDVLERVRSGEDDPACDRCGGILKSTTVSFGQALDPKDLQRAEEAAAACEVFLAIGTTLTVHPAAGYAPRAVRYGARLVVVNADRTPYDHLAAAVVRVPISAALPVLLDG